MRNLGACFLILSFGLACRVQADDRVQWLSDHAVAIQSIDPDDDADFTDLQPLKKLIGDARLVVLGEQSHGDGAVFLAKARLVKFLHQEMGFDVLAWESGMFDCSEVQRAMRDPAVPMDEVCKRGVFGIWTASAQVRPTLEYVRESIKSERPIETCGFDHQFSAGAATRWPQAMLTYFDAADPALLPGEVRQALESGIKPIFERDAANLQQLQTILTRLASLMDEHREALTKTHGEESFVVMRRCADDTIVSAKSMAEFLAGGERPAAVLNNTRDERMAENLVWLMNERYKNRKVIAWMATFHGAHDIQKIRPAMNAALYDGVVNCGTAAHKTLGRAMYTIGFTAADGKAGNVWGRSTMDLPKPSADSLEDLCLKTGKPFLFIDFKSLPQDHWLRGELVSRPLGYGEMIAIWPNQMDAMCYIKTMFPSTRENALPEYARIRADQP